MAERRSNMGKVAAQDNQSKFNVWKNDLILKPGFRPVRLCWNGYTMVRFLPGLDPGDDYTSFDSFRYGEGYGTWIETIPVVANMLPEAENGSISFVLPDRMDYETNFNCPYKALWFALKKAIKNKVAKSEWKDLVIAGKFGVPLPQWKNMYFAYVNPYHADMKDKERDKNKPDRDVDPGEWSGSDILMMSASAYHALDSTLTEYKESCPVDLTDPASGAFVAFFPEKQPCSFGNEILRSAPSDAQFKGYSVSIHDQYNIPGSRWNGAKPAIQEKLLNYHKSHVKPWEQVFNIMSYDAQAEMLSRYMVGYEDLLCYAWEGTDWVTKQLRDKANGMRQVYPTATPQYQQHNDYQYPRQQPVNYNQNYQQSYQAQSPVNYVQAPPQPTINSDWASSFDEVDNEPPFASEGKPQAAFNIPGASRDMSNFDKMLSQDDIFG